MSCLTTSNLLWTMDLTFQVPMQYCSLQQSGFTSTTSHIQHWVLLLLWLCLFSIKMAEYKDVCSSSLVRTPKLLWAAEQKSTRKCWIPQKKDMPRPRTKEKPQQDGSVRFNSVAQSCLTLCHPMNRSRPGLPVHHQLPEFTQTHVHRVSDTIQPSHPLLSPSPPAPNPSQH